MDVKARRAGMASSQFGKRCTENARVSQTLACYSALPSPCTFHVSAYVCVWIVGRAGTNLIIIASATSDLSAVVLKEFPQWAEMPFNSALEVTDWGQM